MNNWNGVGRITADPELRVTETGVEVCNFTVAINRKFKNSQGEYDTDFINCVAFKKTANLIGDYIKKGDLIGITGRIQTRNYDNKEGKKVYITEVVVDQVEFLSPKKEPLKGTMTIQKEETPTVDAYKEFGEQLEITDEDLPF